MMQRLITSSRTTSASIFRTICRRPDLIRSRMSQPKNSRKLDTDATTNIFVSQLPVANETKYRTQVKRGDPLYPHRQNEEQQEPKVGIKVGECQKDRADEIPVGCDPIRGDEDRGDGRDVPDQQVQVVSKRTPCWPCRRCRRTIPIPPATMQRNRPTAKPDICGRTFSRLSVSRRLTIVFNGRSVSSGAR